MIEFIGHLHPLLVHLPIGILLLALLLQVLSRKKKYYALQHAIPVTLLAGAISGLFASVTGYLLSISDDYDKDLVSWHMWMGIATTLTALILYAKEKNDAFKVNKTLLSLTLLVLIMVTGHLGGSLTHGSDYLSKPLENITGDDTAVSNIKPIADVQQAQVYADVVEPILATKCYSCHGANKQKGKLRMDNPESLMKGGEDGAIITSGNAAESEMIKRLLLPMDNDDHMPPKEKSQLSESQVALLHWWINNGAAFNKTVKELPQDGKIKPLLLALQNVSTELKAADNLPAAPVEPADANIIKQLKEQGAVVLPLALNSNYLSVNFMNDTIVDTKDLQLLTQLHKQLFSLKLSNSNITDAALANIAQCTTLGKLYLDGTAITDNGLKALLPLDKLFYLNLVNTKITAAGITQLKPLKNLAALYIYQTNITGRNFPLLQQTFPNTRIDTGGYIVPTLTSDTTLVTQKQAY
ncbi:hypothetical protein I5907_04065 [Panacibacter sp. DH6]|uniref:Cytochrome c domain-containing protein n=1 Tax=Panacibacter microcysteis TaxID=2793269 RepID=A0A931E510_9BACT|nr:c-type cytochrome domain-containing protein [Panacibacter microcysteis]MBG9375395.1 hypothetical protein [Panacibacter microcysteis]